MHKWGNGCESPLQSSEFQIDLKTGFVLSKLSQRKWSRQNEQGLRKWATAYWGLFESGIELDSFYGLSTKIQFCKVMDVFHISQMGKLRMRDIPRTLPRTTDLVSDTWQVCISPAFSPCPLHYYWWHAEDLQDLLELTPQKDVLFVIGDWNAKVGSQETPGVTGKFGLGIENEAGQRLIEFAKKVHWS